MTEQGFIRRWFARRYDLESPAGRAAVGKFEGWFSVVANTGLAAFKLVFGIFIGSIALLADAVHTFSDVVSSAVVIWGFKISSKPADREHPFGHGRAETVATLTLALLMGIVGFEFLKAAVERLLAPENALNAERINWLILALIFLSALAKEAMARFSYLLGDLIQSDTLKGDALHHRSDVYATLLVLVGLLGSRYGLPWLDGVMGLAVAGMILYTAYGLARGAMDEMLGRPVPREMVEKIAQLALKVPGVLRVHDVVVHAYGDDKFISLHIEIPEDTSPSSAHHIADNVERKLNLELNAQVVTHIDPVATEGEVLDKVRNIIRATLSKFDLKRDPQDLRLVRDGDVVEAVLFEVPVPPGFNSQTEIKEALEKAIHEQYPGATVLVDFKRQVTE